LLALFADKGQVAPGMVWAPQYGWFLYSDILASFNLA
jgi:hypothetical protein